MKKRNIIALGLVVGLAVFSVVGCSKNKAVSNEKTIVVGATQVPHAEILQEVKGDLAAKGYTLDVKVLSDYKIINKMLNEGSIDANFFQHYAFLNSEVKDNGYKIKAVAGIHLEPMGLYSKKYNSLLGIPQGAKIAVPNDPTNEARALQFLHAQGLIVLDDPTNPNVKAINVKKESKVSVVELDAAQLSRTLQDVDAAMINTNFALQAGLKPAKDAIAIEDSTSEGAKQFINILVSREDNAESDKIKALKEVLTSEKVEKFIEDKYQGDVVPAF